VRLRSLQAKLTAVTVSTVAVALLCLGVSTTAYDGLARRRAVAEGLALQAAMVARGATAAVAFDDGDAAREAVEVLRGAPDVVQAAVYGRRGTVLAEYRSGPAAPLPPPGDDGTTLGAREATAFHSIWLDGERIGTVYLRASTAGLGRQLRTAAAVSLLLVLLSLAVAGAVARRLQRAITGPVVELKGTMERVAASRERGVRARVAGGDEVAVLAAGLNGMLDALEQRDAELERQRRTLEDTVAVRTAQLARANARLEEELAERQRLHEQLTHAQKMEAVGRLAGGIAHDFNNILAVVALYAGELADELPDGEAREGACEIERATERAVALTRQLLAFSRKQVVNPGVLDTGRVVTDISRMIARLIGDHIELTVRIGAELGHVFMDPAQLEQVLVNLAVNARDAMPEGGRLLIEAEDVTLDDAAAADGLAPGRYVRIRVADSGVGMDADTRARAFEPFFTTKPKGRGTGLGLAMVYGAVEGAGGRISLDSEPGLGATFAILLPRAHPGAAPGSSEGSDAPGGRGERILLVEDADQVRAAVSRMLSRAGYAVVEARDGEDGLARHGEAGREIDLVLTDLVMPGMGGLALGARLRERDPDLPVLYMSGYSEELLHDRSVPAEHVLPKPLDRAALLARIRQLLDGRARPARAAGA
jgi:signal transduction histidine kinase/CheY-like chemotaxis protein